MMNRAFLLIGLVYLLPEVANGGCLSNLLTKNGFDGLNKWLVKSLPDETSVDKNRAHVENNLDKLPNPKVKRAAEIFLEFSKADKCDDNLLVMVREMAGDKVNLGGLKRIENVMRPNLDHINAVCGAHIKVQVENLYRSSLADKLAEFLRVLVLDPHFWRGPIGTDLMPKPDLTFFDYIEQRGNRSLDPDERQWRNYLNELAKNDPKAVVHHRKVDQVTGKFKIIYDKENFTYAFKKYLVDPCKLLTTTIGNPIRGLQALDRIQRKHALSSHGQLKKHKSVTLVQLMYGFKVCEALLNLEPSSINRIASFVEL